MKLTLAELRRRVNDEHDAYVVLEELRWGKDGERLACPHCGHDRAYFLTPKNGVGRGTGKPKADGTRTMSVRRVWKCAKCRRQFSVLTNTIFHGTKVALSDWLTVMVLMCSATNGISGREVERLTGVTPETAWFMLHRLRESMKRDPLAGMLTGAVVQVDETFIGGQAKYMHKNNPRRAEQKQGGPGKAVVVSLVSGDEVRSKVVPDVAGASLRKAIEQDCRPAETVLHTDEGGGYRSIARDFARHETVNHSAGEYVRGAVTINRAESYFSQLKRSLDGTHHHVSREHLPRYLAEFDFRFATRKLSDSARLQRMVGQVGGRRLTYRPLTERTWSTGESNP